jgi:hypothetical protein
MSLGFRRTEGPLVVSDDDAACRLEAIITSAAPGRIAAALARWLGRLIRPEQGPALWLRERKEEEE